ncbi:MAG: hypothetical protein IKK91_00180, partial [Ruminococcus sp.]|nr:hypothetical protein [Ruminococcus sp.]
FAHWFYFSSSHKKSASYYDINSILSQFTDFLQTFFHRLIQSAIIQRNITVFPPIPTPTNELSLAPDDFVVMVTV